MNLSGMSNLQLRVISAVVLAIVVLILTWFGGFPFRMLAAAIGCAMFYEWVAMTPGGLKTKSMVHAGVFAIVAIAIAIGADALLAIGAIIILGVVSAVYAETRGQGVWIGKGFAYGAVPALALAVLRSDTDSGLVAILFLFAVVWATDIAAYFTGRAFGGPKLAPSISPCKTWSGALGGTIGGIAAGMLVANIADSAGYGIFLVAMFLAIVSQFGDLFESATKRQAGVKDSSQLIPGHGGVMDRVDGLVAAAVALYVIGALGGSFDHPASTLF